MSKSDESELAILGGLYEAYASRHVRNGTEEAAAQVDRRYSRPMLPGPAVSPLVDPRGSEMVRAAEADGFDAEGTDIIPEQAALAHAACAPRVRQRDFRANIAAHPARYGAIATTDLLEDPTKPEVLQTSDDVAANSGARRHVMTMKPAEG